MCSVKSFLMVEWWDRYVKARPNRQGSFIVPIMKWLLHMLHSYCYIRQPCKDAGHRLDLMKKKMTPFSLDFFFLPLFSNQTQWEVIPLLHLQLVSYSVLHPKITEVAFTMPWTQVLSLITRSYQRSGKDAPWCLVTMCISTSRPHVILKSDVRLGWTSSPFITNSVIQLFQPLHALKTCSARTHHFSCGSILYGPKRCDWLLMPQMPTSLK